MSNSIEQKIAELDQLSRAAEMAATTMNRLTEEVMRNGKSSAALSNVHDILSQQLSIEERRLAVLKEIDVLQKSSVPTQQASTRTQANHVHGGSYDTAAPDSGPAAETSSGPTVGKIPASYMSSVNNAVDAFKKNYNVAVTDISDLAVTMEGAVVGISGHGIGNEARLLPKNAKLFVDEMGNWGKTLDELARSQFLNDPVNKEKLKFAQDRGYGPETYKRTKADENGLYTVSEFQKNNNGVNETLRLRSNPQGELSQAPAQKQFAGFAQGIGKDLGDLAKWSIAIAAIYGPINAATKAIQEMIANQSKLADVSIAVNAGLADTNKIFDDVYKSAKASGESVSGVIDAFGQAFTATSRVNGEVNRYNATINLLDDSLALSKLSTLDQSNAIDVLTAALYQVGPSSEQANDKLARGRELLDQWVRVSKYASVSVETLATGVAVLGDTAETAGLSMEQLNALVATISETSLSSGKETANIAKALVGNYQQASAAKELNRLGIATEDVTGKTRQFLDVMKEVAAMRSSGILKDQDFSRLTLALGGGGVRRQADVARFIENFGRMDQLVSLQNGSTGETSAALAKKLETVDTASTRLSNSFTSLAQTMGNEGGLLSSFTDMINLGTSLVEILDNVASKTGKVTPLLLAMGAATLLMRGQNMTNALANNVTGPLGNALGIGGNGVASAQWLTGERNILGGSVYGAGQGGIKQGLGSLTTLPTLAAIAAPAIQNFRSGDNSEGIANIAGGITGALAGGPVGALVGSAIAEAFVRTTMTYDKSFANLFAGKVTLGGTAGVGESKKTQEELLADAFKSIGGGSENLGGIRAKFSQWSSQGAFFGGLSAGHGFQRYDEGTTGSYKTAESAAFEILKKQNPALYAQIKSTASASGQSSTIAKTAFDIRQVDISKADSRSLMDMQKGRQNELQTQLIKGDLKPADYANRISELSAYSTTATRVMAALVGESGKLPEQFKSAKEAYQAYLDISSSGNEELINQINQQTAAVVYYEDLLKNWTPGTEITNQATGEKFVPNSKADISTLLNGAKVSEANTLQFGQEQVRLQNLKIQDVYGGNITPTAGSDVNKVIAETKKTQDRKYSDLDPRDYEALKKSWEPFKVLVEEAGKVFYKQVAGVDKSLFGENFQSMQQNGQIAKQDTNVPFSTSQATAAQIKAAEAKAPGFIQKNLAPLGYKSEESDAIFSTSDEQITKAHGDQKVIQYLLQQMLDTEKKQLEGIYNLPEGATAMVPYSAALLAPGAGKGVDSLTGEAGTAKISDGMKASWQASTDRWNGLAAIEDAKSHAIDKVVATPHVPGPYVSPSEEGISIGNRVQSSIGSPKETQDSSSLLSVFSQFIDNMKGMLMPQQSDFSGGFKGGKDLGGTARGVVGAQPQASEVSTKLDLKLTSTTQLVVDGRVLAAIIKPYLAADLLKTNESGGTVTRSYVI